MEKNIIFENDNFYYIKKLNCVQLNDGSFEDKSKVIIKKIPYIYPIYTYIKNS